jgi:pantetheine-phosphate adenylyltransferase
MKIGVFPGSFDPLTNGHLDIIERSGRICDKLFIAIARNSAKKPLFSIDERIEIIHNCLNDNYRQKVEIVTFEGLLVNFCKDNNASIIVRGLRTISDFEYEMSIASANSRLAPDIQTVFMMTKVDYTFISSNIVKEIASLKGDISPLVPSFAEKKIRQKYSSQE